MALWGISTTSETSGNNYNIPKFFLDTDRNNTPHNCFADVRGWVYRRYGKTEQSGLSTSYYDEVIVPVAGLNTVGSGASTTGLGLATPVAVFFEDENLASPISIGAGGTTGITTGSIGNVHLVFNELVYVSAGATIRLRAFDANNANETTAIVATAGSFANGSTVFNYINNTGFVANTSYNGQITNRPSFAFTAPSTVLAANVNFLTTATTTGQTVAIGATVIFVNSVSNVSVGSSLSITGKLTNVPVVSVGTTTVQIGTASTIASTITAGIAATFSTRTNATKLSIDISRGFIGVITDVSGGVGVTSSFTSDIIRNIGGAGSTSSVGIGTTTLTVTA
ncbi:hypothetical protein [Flavobacterium sp.]|uniref:hypothetical protein n=1 Tax=Flavobacterium sp. TaxID=239 RepID=UPI0038FC9D6E